MSRTPLLLLGLAAGALSLAGCNGPNPTINWFIDGYTDIGEALFLTSNDRDLLSQPHALGSELSFSVERAALVSDLSDHTVATEDSDIVALSAVSETNGEITGVLTFVGAGETNLLVLDALGSRVDVQSVDVRAITGVRLQPWAPLESDDPRPISTGETIHLVPGSELSLLVEWLDEDDTPLLGGNLLGVNLEEAPEGLSLDREGRLNIGNVDAFDLKVETDAVAGDAAVDVRPGAGTESSIGITVHDASEVTAVELSLHPFENPPDDGTQGWVLSDAMLGETAALGAQLSWTNLETGDLLGIGSRVSWEPGDADETTLVQGCFGEVCAELEVPGIPARVRSDLYTGCLSSIAPLGGSTPIAGVAFALLIGLGRSRRRS